MWYLSLSGLQVSPTYCESVPLSGMTPAWFRRKSIEETHLRTPSRKGAVPALPGAYPKERVT